MLPYAVRRGSLPSRLSPGLIDGHISVVMATEYLPLLGVSNMYGQEGPALALLGAGKVSVLYRNPLCVVAW